MNAAPDYAAALAHYVPMAAAATEANRAKLQADLAAETARFDPDFEFSDDHRVWSEQNERAKRIRALKLQLGVA